MDDILSAIQNQDTDKILSLFAPNALADSGHNEDNVATLFDYCPRTFQDYDNWAGPNGEATKEDGKRTVILYGTYDVPSGAVTYRFAFKYITQDDNDEQNVGLWSLYVLAVEEEADLVYAYWGDDLFHPGIYIDIPNNEPTIEQ